MKKPSTTAFVLLPKSILKHPPIAHRGQPSAGLLTPFDMAVLAAVVALARAEGLASERHRAAMEHGEQAMQKKRAKYVEKDKKRRDHLFAEERRRFGDPIDHNIPCHRPSVVPQRQPQLPPQRHYGRSHHGIESEPAEARRLVTQGRQLRPP